MSREITLNRKRDRENVDKNLLFVSVECTRVLRRPVSVITDMNLVEGSRQGCAIKTLNYVDGSVN